MDQTKVDERRTIIRRNLNFIAMMKGFDSLSAFAESTEHSRQVLSYKIDRAAGGCLNSRRWLGQLFGLSDEAVDSQDPPVIARGD